MDLLRKKEVLNIIKEEKKKSKKIVFTNGCFDILHVGHLRYLKQAKQLGDILVVGLNSDDSVKNLKGKNRPYVSQENRAEMLLGLKPVNYVIIFNEKTPIKLLDQVKPDVHVKGGDYKKEELPETKVVEKNGGTVKIVSLYEGNSSTNLIKKIQKGE
ncbi:MAG: D-glycero-beta-D-manno-heptose 1-phosphate adenylyltransferase [Fusobacteriota bacterium]